jgi:hypothetical protein
MCRSRLSTDCYREAVYRDEQQSAADFAGNRFFSLDVLGKEFRILRVSRFRHSGTLERPRA